MAIIANVTNGKLDEAYTKPKKNEESSLGSKMGYDQFLKLLCAEMQYQDPLEPTTNTDYVAQMATFSQLEATLSLEKTGQNSMANDLVGKQVILATEDTNGNKKYIEGRVDYVMYENGDVMLSVNNNLYPLSALDTVADDSYFEAAAMSKTFASMMSQFPDDANLTLGYKKAVEQARTFYDNLTDYQKDFIDEKDVKTLQALEIRISELQKAADAIAKNNESSGDSQG